MGGLGADVEELAEVARTLARGCGSTAMIWSMSQITLSCLLRHSQGSPAAQSVRDRAVAERWLIASVVSEKGAGGDIFRSEAALTRSGPESFAVQKQAASVSYAEYADCFMVTARRSPSSPAGDQAVALVRRDQAIVKTTGTWNTLGMRGTCTLPLELCGEFDGAQLFTDSFRDIAAQTMTPLSCVLQASVWHGIAEEAVARAAQFTRRRMATSPQTDVSPALAEAHWRLRALKGQLAEAASLVNRAWRAGTQVGADDLTTLNALKLGSSELAVEISHLALRCCGMAGYSEDGPFSVARLLRDLLSAPLMISNDRIKAANAVLASRGR